MEIHTLDALDKITIDDYSKLIDSKFASFQQQSKNCCMALTKSNLQCKYFSCEYKNKKWIQTHILCKLHRRKKYNPEYGIVYIDNYKINKNNGIKIIDDNEHIIAYPYKNKEHYYKDIEIYKKELKDTYIDNLLKIKQITTCKVCNDTFIHNELIKCNNITCDNKHSVCSSCLSGYIDSQISNNIGTYECMFNKADKCNGTYAITSIDKIITTSGSEKEFDNASSKSTKLSKWQELVTITDIFKLANICDNYIICPLCRKWGCILEIDPLEENNINIKCHNCKLKWCNLCKRKEHGDSSCYKITFTDEEKDEKRIHIIDTMILDIISKALTHKCSTCGSAYIKEEGCNLMHCSHCGGMTCYLCNAKIYYKEGRGKYWHFAGHEFSDPGTTCLTWNSTADDGKEKQGNTDYNRKKIIKELLTFLTHNHNSKHIQEIIFSRIRNLYEKDEDYKFIREEFVKLNINI
jgi:hypothetical protein